uniref:Uncharacterized protein n=1 Tax=Anguilla anguilla TaxID=7936 RepID=A0A0E9UJY2_ANGAN
MGDYPLKLYPSL